MSFSRIPWLGFGTWELKGQTCIEVVSWALFEGYCHIDTAHEYENHREVGLAMKSKKREEIFLTTKLSPTQIRKEDIGASVQSACELALKELDIDYIDLYLIHYPEVGLPFLDVFEAMGKLLHQGKVKALGVSNFTLAHLEEMQRAGFHPSANQLEFHPYLFQNNLLEYSKQHQIELISHRSLGKRKGRDTGLFSEDPLLQAIGSKYQKSWAQVILRWLVQKGIHVIPKSSTRERLRENAAIFDFELSIEEMDQIDSLHNGKRFCMEGDPLFAYTSPS